MKTSVAPPGILGGEPRSPSAGAKGLRTEREVRARLSEVILRKRSDTTHSPSRWG